MVITVEYEGNEIVDEVASGIWFEGHHDGGIQQPCSGV